MLSKQYLYVIRALEKGYRVLFCGIPVSKFGNILKTRTNSSGYKSIGIKLDGKTKTVYLHKLMAYQKFGVNCFKCGVEVRHFNGDSEDNSYFNIGLGTHSENMLDVGVLIRLHNGRAAGRTNSNLEDKDILDMREEFAKGAALSWAVNRYKIAKSTASYIKNRRTYKYL